MKVTEKDIKALLTEGEHNTLEMKRCRDSVPNSVWETYSAFANTRGGVILLGVTEDKEKTGDERFVISGVSDANKVVTDFFNMLHNKQKVNRSVVVDSNVRIVPVDGVDVVYIHVPEADYREKPIYINNNLQSGTYRRVHEGDAHVSDRELAMMIRDSSDDADLQIIEHHGMDDIDPETLRAYRQVFRTANPGHVYDKMDDKEFLINMGGYAEDPHRGIEGLTAAGLLMFGKSVPLHRNFSNFRVDYLDLIGIEPGGSKKWNDRLTDDGRWVDNIYNFLSLALNKLLFTLPSEGRLKGVRRIDGGDLYEGVREAFVNSLTYCDYRLGGVLRIDRRTDRIVMRNPGTLRISPERIYKGDYTQARNSTIQKMLRMIGFGDNIGSGFQKILNAWRNLGFPAPEIHEEEDVNEVWLTLPLALNNVGEKGSDHVNDHENDGVNDGVNGDDHVNDHVNDGVNDGVNGDDHVNDGVNDGVNVPDHENDDVYNLTNTQKSVLKEIIANPSISSMQLCDILGISDSTVTRATRYLKKQGIIKRVGSDKSGVWEIRLKNN